MKNYLLLLIFLQFLIIKADPENLYYTIQEYNSIFKSKCEDDKAKTGACMYTFYDEENERIKEYALFDKCGKGKSCVMIGDDDEAYGKCSEIFEFRKSGESCNYDKDCESNSCINNKCSLAEEGKECDTTHGKIGCKAGLICTKGTSDTKRKCYKLADENEDGTKYGCLFGLAINKEGKCKKYGTLEDGEKVPNYGDSNLLCKSGYSKPTTDEPTMSICVSLTTEPTCSKGKVTSKGEWSNKDEISVNSDREYDINYDCLASRDYSGTVKYYYKYSQLQSKLYKNFLEDYNNLDLKKINSDDKYAHNPKSSFKWKTLEKYLLYQNAPELYAAGLIDSEGKKKSDKECEYDYILKDLNSNFMKFNILIIAMIALLF